MANEIEPTWPSLHQCPIAIVGMAALFPEASNLREYWENIVRNRDCLREVDASRWDLESYYDPDPAAPDKTYGRRGGFIPDVDFDPLEFGIPPSILEVTDGSQLLALIVAREAMRDAGYLDSRPLDRERVGVILGVVGISMKLFGSLTSRLQYPLWEKVLAHHGLPAPLIRSIVESIKLGHVRWEESSFPGMLGNVIAGRIANRFNLGGTNCIVDAACGSSLAAVKMAVSELVEHRCDMMLTGGVDVDNSIFTYLCFSKTPTLSRRERIRPFDAEADGMMLGEGLGMLALKRLADAERDGDRIYAVLRGIGSSSDGRSGSIYAPAKAGQARALERAYQDAGCSPASVGLVEAHGTGTAVGDVRELQALHEAFGDRKGALPQVALGSVKSQIGHTKAAAGAASLIKAALALHHKVLPPTLHVEQPSPLLQSETTPFYVNVEARPWIQAAGGTPRRAGVSSFGFGGTNFHVVLEEHSREHEVPYRLHGTARQVLLHAPDPEQLIARCRQVEGELGGGAGTAAAFDRLADASERQPVPATAARIGFVAESAAEARDLLKLALGTLARHGNAPFWDHPRGIHYRRAALACRGHVVALFSGQGSPYLEMGRELALSFPPLREAFGRLDELFLADGRPALSSVVFPPPAIGPSVARDEALRHTANAQPAIAAFSFGLFKILRRAGFTPDFTAGHSFGEVTALWAAGALTDDDYLALSKARGEAMAAPAESGFEAGGMLAVTGSAERVVEQLGAFAELTVANRNSPRQLVLAGPEAEIERARVHFERQGMTTSRLAVSAAFHSRFVSHARDRLASSLEAVTLQPPRIPVYSNATGERYPESPEEIRRALGEQLLRPVLFEDEIRNLYRDGGTIFVEFGPRNVVTRLVKEILGDQPHLAVALNPSSRRGSDRQLREAMVNLRVAGLPLDGLDVYRLQQDERQTTRPPAMRMSLSGAPYVSAETKKAFADSLAAASEHHEPLDAGTKMEIHPMPDDSLDPQRLLESFERTLARVQDHQAAILRTHETYLKEQHEHSRAILVLVQQQFSQLGHNGKGKPGFTLPAPAAGPSIEMPPAPLPIRIAAPRAAVAERVTVTEPAAVAPAPAAGFLTQGVLEVVSDKTGYPAEMLELEMDIEANLGIDSIKKIEILGALRERFPGSPVLSAEEVAELRTLQQIVDRLQTSPGAPQPAASATPAAATEPVPELEVSRALLALVSEKTGYPAEMLELDTDMEANLGIDSIKKVEILSGVQERFPDLPRLNPDQMAELRTLGQIAAYVQQSLDEKKKLGSRPPRIPGSSAAWSG